MSRYEVIIVSYGRDHLLGAQLKQIRRLYPDVPICWGLQGEYSPALNDLAAGDPGVRIVHHHRPHITETLNACLRTSKAELVFLLDDDALPCPGWMESMELVFQQHPDLVYCMGREIRLSGHPSLLEEWARLCCETVCVPFVPRNARCRGRIVGWMNKGGFLFGNFHLSGSCEINSPRGCNLALHRRRTLELGGFDEDFRGVQWGFETEFGLRLQSCGLRGRYCSEAAVLHAQVPQGGTRAKTDWSGLAVSVHNHRLVNRHLGPCAWIGALPRMGRTLLRCLVGAKA